VLSSSQEEPCSIHGCLRQSAAVARLVGSKLNMGRRKSAKERAAPGSHSYFSVKTSYNPQGLSLVMCFSSPFLLKKSREYLPESAISLGISPSNSMMCARWSSSRE
jgi:hypothetical protein